MDILPLDLFKHLAKNRGAAKPEGPRKTERFERRASSELSADTG
jgi:hypothetical protein